MSTPDGVLHQKPLRGEALALYERRRAQNREAQRRFRSRKAQDRQDQNAEAQWTSSMTNVPSAATSVKTNAINQSQLSIEYTSNHELQQSSLTDGLDMHGSQTVDLGAYYQSTNAEQAPEICVEDAEFLASNRTTIESQPFSYYAPYAADSSYHHIKPQQQFVQADFALWEDFQFSTQNVMSQHSVLTDDTPFYPTPTPYSHPAVSFPHVQSRSYHVPQDSSANEPATTRQGRQPALDIHNVTAQQQLQQDLDNRTTSKNSIPSTKRPERDQRPLLHMSIETGNAEIVRILIINGVEIDEHDSVEGSTALHVAVRSKQEEMLRLLVDSGADVNVEDDLGRTPLYEAVANGFEAGLRVLLAHGANVKTRTPI